MSEFEFTVTRTPIEGAGEVEVSFDSYSASIPIRPAEPEASASE